MSQHQRRGRAAAMAAFVVAVCLEIVGCVGGRILRARGIIYDPPPPEPLARYLDRRHPVLGWPYPRAKDAENPECDASGSRKVPRFPDPSVAACVSLYGDSFTWSEEVEAAEAWGNVLADRAGCRVSNFGMPGYGTDQAYLRYLENKEDRAPVAVLGVLSENILRNVNRLRNLLYPSSSVALKPRFVVDAAGALQLVPMPTPRSDLELRQLLESPERWLEHEHFLPGGPSGVVKLSFPYTLSVARALSSFRVVAGLRGEPSHAAFYEPRHPAGGLQVTAAIVEAFVREARARRASAVALLIPLVPDFAVFKKTGRWPYASLLAALDRQGVPYLNSGDPLLQALGGREPCSIYKRCSGGHFNEEGYRLLGEIVHQHLVKAGKL